MAQRKDRDQLGIIVAEVEALAKSLRTGIRRKAAPVSRDLKLLAGRLRKQAAHAAAQVEKYAHEVRVELEQKPAAAKRKAAPARKKPAARGAAAS